MNKLGFWIVGLIAVLFGTFAHSGERILVQSTTSTQTSGLYDYLLPMFEKETGMRVDVVAVGTGQAIKKAQFTKRMRPWYVLFEFKEIANANG